ncbi:MAG: hypothetical protein HC855_05070 [Rhizobiales bacterium]|nr:hypothetical protein [Hyphomicrobiales bacterium]
MMIRGTPAHLKPETSATRFWYWHGASGGKYIHSVYPAGRCPPLPGAVYVAVKNFRGLRMALGVGRFEPVWDVDGTASLPPGTDEVHVHLIARNDADACRILNDLTAGLYEDDSAQAGRLAA